MLTGMVESKPHSPTAHASVSNTKVDSLEPALDHPSSSLLFAEAGWHPTECYEIIKLLDYVMTTLCPHHCILSFLPVTRKHTVTELERHSPLSTHCMSMTIKYWRTFELLCVNHL